MTPPQPASNKILPIASTENYTENTLHSSKLDTEKLAAETESLATPIRDLICFSHLRWNFVFQRPQHLMRRARLARIFYRRTSFFRSTGTVYF
jgi:hypothetical protein